MKKLLHICLSFMLFLDICPKTLAAGIDRVDVLSDGTVLTYVSTERIGEFRQALVERINRNRDRKFSTGGNLAIKATSAAAGSLLCWAESHVKNKHLRRGLQTATALVTSAMFFYPEYIKYDVYQVENKRMTPVTCINTPDGRSYAIYYFDDHAGLDTRGLNGLLACLDYSITDLNAHFSNTGMIVVERPVKADAVKRGAARRTEGIHSGVYTQNPSNPGYLNSSIESELRDLNR